MTSRITFKAGDTIRVDNFATFRLESDMENYGHVAFAHARKLTRITKEWGSVKDYTFWPNDKGDNFEIVGADVLTKTEAA